MGMKYLILCLLSLPLPTLASDLMLDYYCGCRGTLSAIAGTSKIQHTPSGEFQACFQTFFKIHDDPSLEYSGEHQQEFAKFTRHKDGDGKPICNSTEIKDYLATFRKLQSKQEDELEKEVEIKLCRADTDYKGKPAAVRKCREALVDLLGENEKVLYDECKEDFRNRGKNKQINKCVRIKAYELLLNTNDAKFFEDICPKEGLQYCANDIRFKLADTYFKSEVAKCTAVNGFNTEESVRVCKDVLLSKILAFSTQEERLKLLKCIQAAPGTSKEAINKCVDSVSSKITSAHSKTSKTIK
jgi:hypothetical protein